VSEWVEHLIWLCEDQSAVCEDEKKRNRFQARNRNT